MALAMKIKANITDINKIYEFGYYKRRSGTGKVMYNNVDMNNICIMYIMYHMSLQREKVTTGIRG